MITLFGTTTSPFARRVRVTAIDKGLPFVLVDSSTDEGQARLRAVSPTWKVPAAQLADGRIVWDSGSIIEELCAGPGGWAPLRAPATDPVGRVFESNVVHAVDEALLALIRLFYLRKDGLEPTAGFLHKECARADHLLTWLDQQVASALWPRDGFGRLELALFTALHWIRFRETADIDGHSNLVAFEAQHAQRPSLMQTRPG